MTWLVASWHKILVGLIAVDTAWDRFWKLWERFKPIEDFIERRTHERRHHMNFVSGLLLAESEAVKVAAFMAKLPTYLPLIQKNIADLQKAASDRSDPAALMADVSTLLTDLNSDLALLATVAPSLAPSAPPAPAA